MQKSWRIRQEHTSIASQEETPMKSLTEFIPKIESHRNLNQNHFEVFYNSKKMIETVRSLNLLKPILKTIQKLSVGI